MPETRILLHKESAVDLGATSEFHLAYVPTTAGHAVLCVCDCCSQKEGPMETDIQ